MELKRMLTQPTKRFKKSTAVSVVTKDSDSDRTIVVSETPSKLSGFGLSKLAGKTASRRSSVETVDVALDQAQGVCNVVGALANGAVVAPGLQGLTLLAQEIITTVQTVRTNKADCQELAQQISEYLSLIIYTYDGQPERLTDARFTENIDRFYDELQDIRSCILKIASRNRLRRVYFRDNDARRIAACKQNLEHAFHQFHLASAITQNQQLVEINHKLDKHQAEMKAVWSASNARISFLSIAVLPVALASQVQFSLVPIATLSLLLVNPFLLESYRRKRGRTKSERSAKPVPRAGTSD